MKVLRRKGNRRLAFVWLIGVLTLLVGYHLTTWKDLQAESFNEGLMAYHRGYTQEAIQLFDKSIAAYRAREADHRAWSNEIYPAPDRGLAARASFQKAKALLILEQPKAALEAYRESLMLNPGNAYTDVALSNVALLEREARYTQYDLELLFAENQQLQQQEGKSGNDGQPGNNGEVPGSEPGSQPGTGDPNSI